MIPFEKLIKKSFHFTFPDMLLVKSSLKCNLFLNCVISREKKGENRTDLVFLELKTEKVLGTELLLWLLCQMKGHSEADWLPGGFVLMGNRDSAIWGFFFNWRKIWLSVNSCTWLPRGRQMYARSALLLVEHGAECHLYNNAGSC